MNDLTIIHRKAEKTTNKIRLPKSFCKIHGYEFVMKIDKNKIVLIPKSI